MKKEKHLLIYTKTQARALDITTTQEKQTRVWSSQGLDQQSPQLQLDHISKGSHNQTPNTQKYGQTKKHTRTIYWHLSAQ